MRKLAQLFILIILATLSACSNGNVGEQQSKVQSWFQEEDRIKVLSSIGMIDDLVRIIGGDHVNHITLILGNIDPHAYELVKGDGEKLEAADIIFYNGVGLEHGPSLKRSLETHPRAISLGGTLRKRSAHLFLEFDGLLDPHFWMDVSMWRRTVPIIIKELSHFAPSHKKSFEENGRQLMEDLLTEHEEIIKMMTGISPEKRFLVSSHDAFNYFARAYLATRKEKTVEMWGKRCVSPEGLAPESQISTSDIQRIMDHMKMFNLRVLFTESNVSKDSIKKIVDAGSQLGMDFVIADETLFGDAMGPEGSSEATYIGMLRHNARVIKTYLNGENDGNQTKY
ncbi:Uncharacterized metal-binding lipoprotein TC_0338 [Chlamydiales bacterium SCGC AG-110-M15]|nr:Uncharacterized metal-binding lipoprotein TC_0338 [Chlamydiales bacterium SCGC AG-110-M15]